MWKCISRWRWDVGMGKVEQTLPRLALSGILAGVVSEISGPEYHKIGRTVSYPYPLLQCGMIWGGENRGQAYHCP